MNFMKLSKGNSMIFYDKKSHFESVWDFIFDNIFDMSAVPFFLQYTLQKLQLQIPVLEINPGK